jgi:hypothetical protein
MWQKPKRSDLWARPLLPTLIGKSSLSQRIEQCVEVLLSTVGNARLVGECGRASPPSLTDQARIGSAMFLSACGPMSSNATSTLDRI